MSYTTFARELVLTGELDPLYTMLYRARDVKGDDWVKKFCMYLLMFYETEGAYQAAEVADFWDYVEAMYPTAPRGSERRYFRGEAGIACYTSLRAQGGPISAFQIPVQARTLPEMWGVLNRLKIVGFGEYFLLKWVDLLNNVFEADIDVSDLPRMLPSPPLKCLKTIFPGNTPREGLDEIVSWISDLDNPFSGHRKCGYSEAETVACAIPSYLIKGKYKLGDDIAKYHYQLRTHPELTYLLPTML